MMSRLAVWAGFAIVLMVLPLIFSSSLGLSILNQMTIAVIFALSYNMLLGQGGMLSFGHAVYYGMGGFIAIHLLNMIEFETLMLPVVLIPLAGGVGGLLVAVLIGTFSTRRAGTVFAMISLGIGELFAASSLIFESFFGGEGGISGWRDVGPTFFGIDFGQQIEVYYLAAFWVFMATLFMYLFTRTPAGRMANAVRDNHERAEFIGYSARKVRYITFCAAGLFAGIAGGLFAINYEIVTEENLTLVTSGEVLLMAYIGGLGFFIGPIVGAVLLTLMSSVVSAWTDMWMLYLGILFVLTVMFLPRGLSGLIIMHGPAWHLGRLRLLILPYTISAVPALLFVLTLMGMIELAHSSAQEFVYLGLPLNPEGLSSWLLLAGTAAVSWLALQRTLPQLRDAWETANALPRPKDAQGEEN
ncbi:MAG: branched-chain amino acid ABC transporter permease [Pseudohongiellaceae bacterium]